MTPTTDDMNRHEEHYRAEQARLDATPPVTRMLSCVLLIMVIVFGLIGVGFFIWIAR